MSTPPLNEQEREVLALACGAVTEWPSNERLGGGPTGTRDDEFRAMCYEDVDAIDPVVRAIRDAAVAAERDRLLGKVEALLPAWSGGDVVHEGGFSHSSALQCERCPGWPHASCVHPADLRALVAEERAT